MKNKILIFVFMAVGAVMLSITSGFANPSKCDVSATQCANLPTDCNTCHTGAANTACKTNDVCYFCPDDPSCNPTPACNDNDNDGYGDPGDSSCANSGTDCNDNDASINPGAAENCTDNVDNNCNGKVDTQDPNAVNCPDCSDSDGDSYSPDGGECGAIDCDDNAANVNPGTFESCIDGVDNDCNGQTDCSDSSCDGEFPACPLEFCEDYGDRRSCKSDSRCSWSGKGKNCFQPVVYDNRFDCEADGGRWNNKKESCSIR